MLAAIVVASWRASWAQARRDVARASTPPVRRAAPRGRKRVLDNDELRSVWTAAGNGVSDGDRKFGAIVKLLILVPQRREKIISMQWSDIKGWILGTVPLERTPEHPFSVKLWVARVLL
jgi:integrase